MRAYPLLVQAFKVITRLKGANHDQDIGRALADGDDNDL